MGQVMGEQAQNVDASQPDAGAHVRRTERPPVPQAKYHRTVHIVERLAPDGIETLVLDLLRSGPGDDMVFSLQGSADALVEAWPALREHRGRIDAFDRRPGVQPGLVLRIAHRLRQVRPHAVFVHHIGPLLYGGSAARLARVPRLVHVEHDAWHYDSPNRRLLAGCCARILNPQVVAVSRQVAERVSAVMPRSRVILVPPGIDTGRFRPADRTEARRRLGLDPAWRTVGSVGRLVPVKGHRFLIDALASLPEIVHCVIVGDGPERAALQEQARERGVAARVHFLGHRDDLDRIYPAFGVFCLPSLGEGLPRSVLEAQASGVPVIATAVGGLPEAVCPESGILVEPGDPAALAAGLRQALDRPAPATPPRRFVEDHFSWSRTLGRYRALAEE